MNDQTLKNDLTWLQKHERIILAFMLFAVLLFLGNKWMNSSAANADAKYAAIEQKLEAQKTVTDTLTKAAQEQMQQYQQMVTVLSQQNASLASAIASRDSELARKQKEIASMTLPQVAREWENALGLVIGSLPVQGASVVVSEPAARQTVTELAKVPVLTANLADETKVAANLQTELGKCNAVISAQTAEIKGLNDKSVLQDSACKAEVAKVKADGRKSKRNWFIAGFVSGIATRLFFKF